MFLLAELLNVTVVVPPLNVPLEVKFPASVCDNPVPALNVALDCTVRSPLMLQLLTNDIPDPLELLTVTLLSVGTPDERVMAPDPANSTVPELLKEVPGSVSVTADEGENFIIPLLDTVPLLVKVLLNVCVKLPPLNMAPFATVNVLPTVHPIDGEIPPVLLTVTIEKFGEVPSENVGATVPLKFTVPVLVNPLFSAIV